MKTVYVVGAVIENDRDEILCALRSAAMSMPNLWEFPGGKIVEGEKPEEALTREIREELNCIVKVGSLIEEIVHHYPNIIVNLSTYKTSIIQGTPTALEHEKLSWVKREDLLKLEWAPADIPTVKKLV